LCEMYPQNVDCYEAKEIEKEIFTYRGDGHMSIDCNDEVSSYSLNEGYLDCMGGRSFEVCFFYKSYLIYSDDERISYCGNAPKKFKYLKFFAFDDSVYI
jgi:hypothetical protein